MQSPVQDLKHTDCHCFSNILAARQPVASRLLANAVGRGKRANAYLLTGRCAPDKWLLARQLTAFLNCGREDKEAKGSCLLSYLELTEVTEVNEDDKAFTSAFTAACQNCRWLYRDEHPKAWVLLARDAGKSGKIPVESARNLSEELARTSQYVRVVVIENAAEDAFHRPAANALLKTIEEPRSNCLFLLFAECEDDVLRTIVSRCQTVPFNNVPEENLGSLAAQSPGLKSRLAEPVWQSSENQELVRKMRGETFLQIGQKGDSGKKMPTKDALSFAHHLTEDIDDHGAEKLFDLALAIEIDNLAGSYRTHPGYSRYLSELFKLVESAKRQIDGYVIKKGVCEALVLEWLELRNNLSAKG
jgi:hypothetical protein